MGGPTNDVPAPGRLLRARRPVGRVLRAVRGWRPRHGWWSAIALVVAGVLVSVVVGVTTASVQASLGPHVTRYDVTTDATVTIDFGPLGTLQLDSPLPATLGLRATVQEIPATVTELGEARTLEALGEDLNAYVAFFSGPAAAVQDIANALVRDALLRSGTTFVVLVALFWLGRALLGGPRSSELTQQLAAHARPLTAGGLAVVVGATVLTSSVGPQDRREQEQLASPVFDGTPLEGARVTGRLGGVIDTYGAYAVDAWRQNEEFYQAADAALVVAWEDWEEQEALLAAEAAAQAAAQEAAQRATGSDDGTATQEDGVEGDGSVGDGAEADGSVGDGTVGAEVDGGAAASLDGDGGGAGDGQDGTAGAADALLGAGDDDVAAADRPSASPRSPAPSEEPEPEVEPVVLVVVSDLHCNVGMAPLIGTLARLSGAAAVLDAGDTTMNGTSVEQYCVTSFARAVPPGVALVTAPGNHDSRETTANYARAGATVLDGSVIDVAGVRVLGDSDPNETRVGAGGTASAADETVPEAAERLAATACEDGEVDLLLVHTPAVGDEALAAGCVPAQVSGHLHRRSGPEQVGLGIRYISGSTAGATLNQPTVGPLRGVAEMTVLRFDPGSRRLLDLQVVRVAPDATVTVGSPQPWPLPAVVGPGDAADQGGDGGAAGDEAVGRDPQEEPGATPDGGTDAQDG
ncbi:metallophosphoesterase family protein [Cellulomonas wangleii]|uniref:metallophosphoesterase family protein n=1 Tax=Cellulomonas wangleii TaxID=2816956 RepID=UPI0027DDC0C3|nr:metallophosphoesterase [Cellulomonas wangleii]